MCIPDCFITYRMYRMFVCSGIQLFLNILSTFTCFGSPLDENGVSDLHQKIMAYTLAYTAYLCQVSWKWGEYFFHNPGFKNEWISMGDCMFGPF